MFQSLAEHSYAVLPTEGRITHCMQSVCPSVRFIRLVRERLKIKNVKLQNVRNF